MKVTITAYNKTYDTVTIRRTKSGMYVDMCRAINKTFGHGATKTYDALEYSKGSWRLLFKNAYGPSLLVGRIEWED